MRFNFAVDSDSSFRTVVLQWEDRGYITRNVALAVKKQLEDPRMNINRVTQSHSRSIQLLELDVTARGCPKFLPSTAK